MTQTIGLEGKELKQTLLVEWWAKPAREIEPDEMPYQTECEDIKEAETLEKKFLSIGWTARAVIIQETRTRRFATHEYCPPTFVKSPRSENTVDGLHFTVRTLNGLKAARISSLAQLITWSREKLLETPNVGANSVNEISDLLSFYDLRMASKTDATCLCDR